MPRERPLHYRVSDDHPNIIEGSMFRPVLCDQRAVFLHESNQKKARGRNSMDGRVWLGFDYKACDQAYYTDDPDRVTCKNCLKKLGRLTKATNTDKYELELKKLKADNKRIRRRIYKIEKILGIV